MRLERGHGSVLSPDVLFTLLVKLTPTHPSPTSSPPPLPGCALVCFDQPTQTWLLRKLPMLDDISVTMQ
jgi:hypothetical protein